MNIDWTTVIAAVVGSAGATEIIKAIAERIKKGKNGQSQLDRIESKIGDIKSEVDTLKLDQLRTNLMLLLCDFRDSADIQKLAKDYVVNHDGDSYIIPLLVEWYDEKKLAYPEWLKVAYDKHCQHKLDENE